MPFWEKYGNNTKRIVFSESDHRHAKLIIKLRYLEISQAAFFRHIISGIIEEDPRIIEFVNEISKSSKAKKVEKRKLQQIGGQKMKDFNLTEDDVTNIFDIIEGEHLL